MPIPDYQSFMLPLLKLSSDGKDHSIKEAVGTLADEFGLSAADRQALLPSGTQTVVYNRVGWARTYVIRRVPCRGQAERTGGSPGSR